MALPRIPPGVHGRPGPHRVCGAGVAGQHIPARPSFQFLLKRPGTPGAAPPGTWADRRVVRRAHSWPFLSLHVPSFSPRLGGGNLCTPGDPTHVGGLGTPPAPGPGGGAARSGHGRSRAGRTVGQGRLGARSQERPPLGCVEEATAPRLPREGSARPRPHRHRAASGDPPPRSLPLPLLCNPPGPRNIPVPGPPRWPGARVPSPCGDRDRVSCPIARPQCQPRAQPRWHRMNIDGGNS